MRYSNGPALGYTNVDWRQGVVRRGYFDEKIPVVRIGLEKEKIIERE
jgi:hypothetical protein